MLAWLLVDIAVADEVLDAVGAEVDRAMSTLAAEESPPYYIAAEVTEGSYLALTAEDGALHGYSPRTSRRIDVDLRIGTPELDSSHHLRGSVDRGSRIGRALPLGDDMPLLQHFVWREIDQRYRSARERWSKVDADRATLVEEDQSFDLSPLASVATVEEDVATLELDPKPWEDTLRKASAVLAQDHVVRDGAVTLSAQSETYWFVSSEGTRVRHSRTEYGVHAIVDTIAEDGTVLALSRRWAGRTPASLPTEDELLKGVGELHELLTALRTAPELEPYNGPVILSDRAAGVFFHEIFGHRVEGHRLKRVDNAQTFRDMVGESVLPDFLSVHDDPTQTDYLEDIELRGHYRFDNEGVPAQRVTLVENGVLKGFLQSRSPTSKEPSNGHGRRQAGRPAVTRQGNLIVTSSKTVSDDEMRSVLLQMAKEQGLEYALRIDDIQGGFTFTNRGMPNAFNVKVLVAYKLFVDGRPDELVRGVDLIGTPLVAFSRIELAGEADEVFNGTCGAESGWVPVSAAAPSLLVSQLETQRKAKGQRTPPLLAAPGKTETGKGVDKW